MFGRILDDRATSCVSDRCPNGSNSPSSAYLLVPVGSLQIDEPVSFGMEA